MWVIERGSGYVFFNNDRVGQLGTSEILVLEFLSDNLGELKNKDELLDFAWPQKVVAPNSLTVAIKNLRKVFSARPSSIEIRTHHGRGYSLHGDVSDVALVEQLSDGAGEKVEPEAVNIEQITPSLAPSQEIEDGGKDSHSVNWIGGAKKMFTIVLCIMLVSASALIWGYNKRIYCEEIIPGVTVCGTRHLHEKDKVQLKRQVEEQLVSQDERYTRYVYGYNYSPKNLVLYPVM